MYSTGQRDEVRILVASPAPEKLSLIPTVIAATTPGTTDEARKACLVAVTLAVVAAAIGTAAFLAWALDIPVLANWGGDITMQPNTALAGALAGIAIILRALEHRWLAIVAVLIPGAVGAVTLVEHLSGATFGIDHLLAFGREWGTAATNTRGQMGPPAATSYMMIGAGVLMAAFGPKYRRIAPLCGVAVAIIASFSLIGYLFGASPLFNLPRLTAIALPTSVMLSALGMALVFALPEHEPLRTLRADSAAGLLARQSLPFIVIVPVAFAFFRLQGERAGLYDTGMGTAILVLALVILLIGVLWHGVSAVRQREAAQRLVEAQLRDREAELQASDRRKDEFLATLAHELRNPLAPISNALTIFRHSNVDARLVERTRGMMERQINHMVRLIDDLLDISRISSGKLELRTSPVDIAAIIHQVVETARPAIEKARHTVAVSLPRDPISIRGDPVRLAQVFGNLVGNSIKFTEPGGRIVICADIEEDDVVVSVEDNGLGIPEEQLDGIFEIFAQVDRTIERSQGGLGIGLTLAQRLVELHGGRIAVRSDGLGKGSKFIVRLPATAAQPTAVELAAERAGPASKRRILVVDDNRDNAESLAMLLTLSGNETVLAHDGEEAVATAAKFQPDAVLLDLGLPKISGYEACRRIRQQPGGEEVAIYAITGWGQEEDRRKSHEAGFDGHLVKPVDHAELTKILEAL
jgi:signal transduction histidine kinase